MKDINFWNDSGEPEEKRIADELGKMPPEIELLLLNRFMWVLIAKLMWVLIVKLVFFS